MIDALVQRMPQQSREQFEHFFLQLSLIASTTTRIRTALETGDRAAIEETLESAENVGVLPYILKTAVAQAGAEVRLKEKAHDDWIHDTESRMSPLLQSQAQAMVSQKALAQATALLGSYRQDANAKSKKVLLGMCGNKGAALQAQCFLTWADYLRKVKREAEIRKEYEDEINASNKALQDFKAKQIESVKSVLGRAASSSKESMILNCYKALKKELADDKAFKDAGDEAAELEAKLAGYADAARNNAKSVLDRMNAGNADGLKGTLFKAWLGFVEDYKKNKEMEDKVKFAEQRVAEFKSKQKAGATSVLNKMANGAESALVKEIFLAYKELVEEEKRSAEMDEEVGAKAGKLGSFAVRNKGTAMHEMERMVKVGDDSLLLILFLQWKKDTKVDRMRRNGKDKNDKRKQQLVGVKGLFKNFATELESGIKDGTPRIDPAKLKPNKIQD